MPGMRIPDSCPLFFGVGREILVVWFLALGIRVRWVGEGGGGFDHDERSETESFPYRA